MGTVLIHVSVACWTPRESSSPYPSLPAQLLSWATSPRHPARPQLWPLPCASHAHTFIPSLLLTGKSLQLTSDSPRLHLVLTSIQSSLSEASLPDLRQQPPTLPSLSHQPPRYLSTEHLALSYLSPSLLLPPPECSLPFQSPFHFGACLPQPHWSSGLTMPSQGLPQEFKPKTICTHMIFLQVPQHPMLQLHTSSLPPIQVCKTA